MKVFITGVAGFLGSALARRVLSMGYDLEGIDIVPRDQAYRLGNLKFPYIWGSILDLEKVKANYIIHTAAVADVPFALKSPIYTLQQNVIGTAQLLKASHWDGIELFILTSSESVYGKAPTVPIPEDTPLRPTTVYGASKAAQELLTMSSGLPYLIVRSSTLYGEKMRTNQVIPIFLKNALQGLPITVHGTGEQSRDFNYVDNLVHGILLGLKKRAQGVYNIASGREVKIRELAEMCIKITGSSSKIVHVEQRIGEEGLRLAPDIKKAVNELGYKPEVTLEEGLERTYLWMKGLLQ